MNRNANEDAEVGMLEDNALTLALERQPAVSIPADFTARVLQRLPQGQRRKEPGPVGRTIGYASAGAIAAVLIVLVGHNPAEFAAGRDFAFILEMLLVGELLAVGFWLGTRQDAQ